MRPSHIILHHSLTKDGDTVSWGAIRKWHTGVHPESNLMWTDIGYHFGIELIGDRFEILMGRMMNRPGAHCKQEHMNVRSLGICFVGNYDMVPPDDEMWDLGIKLCRSLIKVFKIPVEKVQGHNEYADYKTCPGEAWNMELFRMYLDD